MSLPGFQISREYFPLNYKIYELREYESPHGCNYSKENPLLRNYVAISIKPLYLHVFLERVPHNLNQKEPLQFGFVCRQYCRHLRNIVSLVIRLQKFLFKMLLFPPLKHKILTTISLEPKYIFLKPPKK